MSGYLMNFYKFSPSLDEEMDKKSEGFNRSIVWSVFDRLEIRQITDFGQFRKSEAGEKSWFGERQFAMLYTLDHSKEKLRFTPSEDECRFVFEPAERGEGSRFRFFGISFIDFTQVFNRFFYSPKKAREDFEDNVGGLIHKYITEAVDALIKRKGICQSGIMYEVYGVLGGQDIAIIWLADQFEHIAGSIEDLRKATLKKQKVIANVSSIIGICDINNPEIKYDDVKGKLAVKLTKRESFDADQFERDLSEILDQEEASFAGTGNRYAMFGEHDILIEIPANRLIPQLYRREGLLHGKSTKFRNNFIQAKTEIFLPRENFSSTESVYEFPDAMQTPGGNDEFFKFELSKSGKLYQLISDIVKEDCLRETPYLQETIWLLYEDFLKNITSSFTYPWSNDLYYQFEQSMNYLYALIRGNTPRFDKFKDIHSVISSMRQMILHVAQANRLFFEVPNTHLKHTGAYSKILHMYYGVVKKYLELAYSIPKYDEQSCVIPFITFDVTPIAKSEYCGVIHGYSNNIVRIELPYDALVNITKYIKLLAHEIYHYIAPADRRERNLLTGAISYSLIIGQIARIYLDFTWKDSRDESKKNAWLTEYQNIVRAYALDFFVEKRGLLDKYLKNYNENAVWEDYFTEFDYFFDDIFFSKEECKKLLYEWIAQAVLEQNKREGDNAVSLEEYAVFSKELEAQKEQFLHYPLDRDIRYALREAAADYFMMQATDMPLKEYLAFIMEYRKLMESDEDDIAQKARYSFVIDLYDGKAIQDKTREIPDEETRNDIIFDFFRNYGLSDEDTKRTAEGYIEITEAFSLYKSAVMQYFKMLDFTEISKYGGKFKGNLQEIELLLRHGSEVEFNANIMYVERFQRQKTLQELEKTRESANTKRPEVSLNNIVYNRPERMIQYTEEPEEKVTDLSELLDVVSRKIKKISDTGEPIWFRGHEKSEYLLIPSLYRMKDKKSSFYAGTTSKREMLGSLLDLFRVKAYHAPEILDKLLSDDVKTLATMQHYQMPTNLLDWTSSVFPAIYFALAAEMDDTEKKTKEDAAIYLLNPVRMNSIRNRLYENNLKKPYPKIQYPIPAISSEKKIFRGYLPAHTADSEEVRFPIAGYVAHDNFRIKAQLGTFTIFGLDNKEDCYGETLDTGWGNGQADYAKCSIDHMQRCFEESCRENTILKYQEFVSKVVIDGDSKEKIADSLRNLGINRASYFPELENMSRELTKQVSGYLERFQENNK